MNNDALQTVKRSHKRTVFLAVVLAVVALVSIGLFAFQVYQYPSKIAFALSAFLVAALALTYRYGFYLPMKREESRFGLTSNRKRR
jgi:CHASE2 domain-containing sensor protein